jgi:membrane peptidoglycan carboxypeptidase
VGVHPLELWLVRYLRAHPDATLAQVLEASAAERQEAYAWLFRTTRRAAQDLRIATLVEEDAFASIHRTWRRLGFPFEVMVPSLASAIGSSGDRPTALAELMGVIVNDGVRHPRSRISELHFAEGTPYETVVVRPPDAGDRVMSAEVARATRGALVDVVEHGTARRLHGAFTGSGGRTLTVGAKTGTGDNRHQVTGTGGRVIQSRPTSRTATIVFFIGERHFGVMTAYVEGPDADRYRFTSGLAAQVLRQLAPVLEPLFADR